MYLHATCMVKYRISLTNSGRSAKKMSQLCKNWSAPRCSNPKGGQLQIKWITNLPEEKMGHSGVPSEAVLFLK